ncbi:hypothetical protein [Ramlibacter rhizophilus]|uniref:DUF1579 domain-containing protein n=1 Tax=Ramlibacter rhizophilus TaxID=1781167 RepID=A0A4Z0BIU8_9BURK|nr:hypothetical protein [Ramlibacter rhizophilus]TFY98671.1 hypothetical protein EZ242_14195 [Ramlibacter rhizophilus]
MLRVAAVVLLSLGAIALAAGDGHPGAPAATHLLTAGQQDVQQKLFGTWLREQTREGVHTRRLLRLDPDGAFTERVRITEQDGRVTQLDHGGSWFYDGTNLKRKYTLMSGRPPSRLNLPFATFQVRFETRNEFLGTDHVGKHQVRYRRVQPETEL